MNLNLDLLNKTSQIKKKWQKTNTKEYLTLREYNRLARQAARKGIQVAEYLDSLGYILMWGEGRGRSRRSKNID